MSSSADEPSATSVLVADRNAEFLKRTEAILREHGVEMLAADSSHQAIERYHASTPTGALINVELPTVGGPDVCRQLKQSDPSVPVVLMSSDERSAQQALRESGADNFLVRPLKTSELMFAVRSMQALRVLLGETIAARLADGDQGGLGTVTRAIYDRFLGLEVRRALRYGFPLAVLSIEPDPLPANIDDRWLRALTQQLTVALASAIRDCMREIDLSTVPVDGDTLVLMPHTDLGGARIVAERIRRRIAAQPYHFGRDRIQPTVSIGLAVLHGERLAPDELVDLARSRRKSAAGTGGNLVQVD